MMMEGINQLKVCEWLQEALPEIKTPVSFSLLAGGYSNLTFKILDAAGASYVLRRPPLGRVLERAHDMGREYKIISALQSSAIPVPRALALGQDVAVNGAPFYVMDYVDGRVLHNAKSIQAIGTNERHTLGLDVIDILSTLHQINPDELGLEDLGRKEAYLQRQLQRWVKQWQASKTHEIPEMDQCVKLLTKDMPMQVGASIVHGDYRLGNMIAMEGRVRAVLDWELCTLGDPLADLGYLLNNWFDLKESTDRSNDYLSRQKICEIYAQKTGRDLSRINYYRAFSHWRLASIQQGGYKRYLMGAMGDHHKANLEEMKNGVAKRARRALELLR